MTGFLLLLNSGNMPEQSGNRAVNRRVKIGEESARGERKGTCGLQFPDDNVSACGPLGCTQRGGLCALGAQRLAPLPLCTEAESLAHPVQAAQILHHVLVGVVVIVEDGVLFVHTARLQPQSRGKSLS